MSEKQAIYDWNFCVQWIVSCVIATAILGMAAYSLRVLLSEMATAAGNEQIGFLIGGLLFGAFFALGGTLGPGLLLQAKGIPAGRWIGFSVAVSVVAISGGTSLMSNLLDFISAPFSAVFLGLVFGLPMGLVQWWLLTKQGVSAAAWPLINVAAYLLGFFIVVYFSAGREWVVGMMGLVVGMVTGLGMMWLLRQEAVLAA